MAPRPGPHNWSARRAERANPEVGLRILLVNDYAAPIGGAEIQMAALRDEFRGRGHKAFLFSSCAGDSARHADASGFGSTGPIRSLLQVANPWAARAFRRALREFRPDVVHIRIFLTQLSPLILPTLSGVPALYHAVWYRAICPTGTKMRPGGAPCASPPGLACAWNGCVPPQDFLPLMAQLHLVRRFWKRFDAVVANSEAVRRRLEGAGLRPVEVIRNGVVPRLPRPALAGPPTAAYAGRLVPAKGVDVLLRAFARVARERREVRLLVAGDGPEQAALARLAARLGIEPAVRFLGHLTGTDLEKALAPAWVQVLPSVWDEPFPNVVAEAMARGTAVIASRCGGVPELVEDGLSGLLVPPADVEALARAIDTVLSDLPLAETMGAAGRVIALERFPLSGSADRFLELYGRLLERRKPGGSA